MSKDWVQDIKEMHTKFNVNERIKALDEDKLKAFLEFRIKFLEEELTELKEAKTADDAVDALIDLSVIAIGSLDAFDVDSYVAWDRVLDANMNKEPGVKPSRPNPFGLPDMIKPEGWTAPTHIDNVGMLSIVYK